jgi:hypothetical protein
MRGLQEFLSKYVTKISRNKKIGKTVDSQAEFWYYLWAKQSRTIRVLTVGARLYGGQ